MMHHTVNVSLWILGGLVALTLLLGSLFVWRLSAGPIPLGFLTPYLEEALTAALSGHRMQVQETVLAWNARRHNLDLRARTVTIRDDTGALLATLPAVDVTLSLGALVRGSVALTAMNIEDAQVSISRDANGTILFGAATAGTVAEPEQDTGLTEKHKDRHDLSPTVSDILAGLMAEINASPLLATLHEVRISNANLTVYDVPAHVTWKATPADITLRRDQAGLTVQLQAMTAWHDKQTSMKATLISSQTSERLRLNASFTQLYPSALAAVAPRLAALAGVDLPLNGALRLSLDQHGGVHDLSFEVSGDSGSVSYTDAWSQPIAGLTVHGRVDAESGTLHFDDATVTLGTATAAKAILNVRGAVTGLKPDDTTDHLSAQMAITFASQNTRATFDTKLSYTRSTAALSLHSAFTNVRAALLVPALPALRQLTGLDVPLDGTLAATLDARGALSAMRFAITGGPGYLSYPGFFPKPRAISRIAASGHFDGLSGTLRLDNATVSLGQEQAAAPILQVSGRATGLGGDITAQGHITLTALPIADIHRYWPPAASPKTRAWITENLVAGTIQQVQTDVVLTVPGGDFSAAKIDRLAGTLRYQALQVHYLRPLPPITGVRGHGSFDVQGFRLRIESGMTASQTLSEGTVTISGLDRGQDAIAIRVDVTGPLREALELLNHPHLNLLSALGLQPQTIRGQTAVQLAFAFSLLGAVALDDVDIKAQGTLENVSIQEVFHEHSVDHGHLSLTLDKQGMVLSGLIDFASVPLTIEWKEAFSKEAAWRSEIVAAAPHMRDTDLTRLGLDLSGYVEGAFTAEATAQIGWTGTREAHVALNLEKTRLILPFLGWQKAVGEPGKAQGTVQLGSGLPVTIQQFEIIAGTLTAHGTAQFSQTDRHLATLAVKPLTFGNSELSEVFVRHQERGFAITIGTGVVDAQPWMQRRADTEESLAKDTATRDPAGNGAHQATPYLHIQAPLLRQISFGPGQYLQNVQLEIKRNGTAWEFIDIAGQVPQTLAQPIRAERQAVEEGEQPQPRVFSVQYRPSPQGPYTLLARTNDLGALLRALNVSDNVMSGRVVIDGSTTGAGPQDPLQAMVKAQRFVVKDAPVLAQVLAAASLPGLHNLLQGDGLLFSQLSAEVTLTNGTMAVTQLHGHGGALGLTAEGEVNLDAGNLNLKGTLIPLYGINSLLGRIPVLNLLVGGKHQGLVAVTYRLTGELTDPQVTVNPAAALTPGFLRHVFDLWEDRDRNDAEDFSSSPPATGDSP